MRYLWVEDFNDEKNSSTMDELKETLVRFFDLQIDRVIVKGTLSSAISFLENGENLDKIDAILIDIRFPEKDENEESELYLKYYSDIVTKEFYKQNIEDASGILLYLLLVFRYHISQQKMAFVSANISNDNAKLKKIDKMVEIICKSKYTNYLSDEDKEQYRKAEIGLGNTLRVSKKEKKWDTFICNNEQVENIDLDNLLEQIKLLPLHYPEKFKSDRDNDSSSSKSNELDAHVKYNTVKSHFEKIGFAMPSAFEKPKIGERRDKSYSFKQWETNLYTNPYNTIRSNVQEMCTILIDYFNNGEETNDKIYSDFLNLLGNQDEKDYYDKSFFIRYVKGIREIFAIDCSIEAYYDKIRRKIEKTEISEYLTENIETYCNRALKDITALWEASAIPKVKKGNNTSKRGGVMQDERYFVHEDKCYYACHATLKLIRNWTGHQGIKNINIIDVGLIFLLNMRGIFDIDTIQEKYLHKYKECEDNILSLYEVDTEVKVEIKESLEYFSKLNNDTKKGANLSREIYDKISGLGHFKSEIRREVSMDEIYMLLYHILSQSSDGIFGEIKERIKIRTWENWRERYGKRFNPKDELD